VLIVTPVNFVQSVDILGIYPTLETLLPQIVLLALAVASIFYYRSKGRKIRAVS
jgi:high-affinity iron transporter